MKMISSPSFLKLTAAFAAVCIFAGCGSQKNAPADFSKITLPDNGTLEMVSIPSGSFKREWKLDGLAPELRKSIQSYYNMEIRLTQPYWIGKYEVTQKQYQAVMGTNPSTLKGESLPVNNVTWQKAKAFCAALNRLYAGKLPANYQFDLPSEAQWEYAAHGGNAAAPGSQKMAEYAWYKANCRTLKPVGLKKPNNWGIYDMSGNAAEWCRDFYGDFRSNDDRRTEYSCWQVTDPVNNQWGTGKVLRGGSFLETAANCWPAVRQEKHDDGKPAPGQGFRVALVPLDRSVQHTKRFTLANGCTLDMVGIFDGIKDGFWMGKYEVTQELFETIMGYNPSAVKGAKNPVDSVSHDEAMTFCEKLTGYLHHQLPERYIFHLPFQHMWEHACRAGTTSPYNAGYDSLTEKIDLDKYVWHKGNSRNGHNPVGQKRPNRRGLHDMHGNVREWCFVTDLPDDKVTVRGGGWKDDLKKCSSAHQEPVNEKQKSADLGFRIILVERHVMSHY